MLLVVDREPGGIVSAIALHRPLGVRADEVDLRARHLLPDPAAAAWWGGPMGHDPSILAEVDAPVGLEWFHLAARQPRPFPLPGVAMIVLGEHPDVLRGRLRRARLFQGLCVWARGQAEREVERGDWRLVAAETDDIFADPSEPLWERCWRRQADG